VSKRLGKLSYNVLSDMLGAGSCWNSSAPPSEQGLGTLLGLRIGHGGNPTNIETPVVPDAEDEGSDEGLDEDPNEGHGTEGDDDILASDNEDEDFFDTGRV
jgi:hypothetical protein